MSVAGEDAQRLHADGLARAVTITTAYILAWSIPLLSLAVMVAQRWRRTGRRRFSREERRVILRRAKKVRRER